VKWSGKRPRAYIIPRLAGADSKDFPDAGLM
jgi:hypothetical protein